MSATHPGYVFDAAAVLGVGAPSSDPLPAPEPGIILLRVPDGLSLKSLRDSPVGSRWMYYQPWYDRFPWGGEAPAAGTYSLRIPVPGSNRMTAREQQAMLPAGEKLAPAALVAAALLCLRVQGAADPLHGEWVRCAERPDDGVCVALVWSEGRVYAYGYWDGYRYDSMWGSSYRATP